MQLVRESISADTVETFEHALASAKSVLVVGAAVVLLLKRRRYMVSCAGEACKNPTFTRGAVLALDDYLQSIIHDNAGPETRY